MGYKTGQNNYEIDQGIGKIYSIQYTPDGNTLASDCSEHTIRLGEVSTLKETLKFVYSSNKSLSQFIFTQKFINLNLS
ncbi:unnamed protein product [Paramecium sonneborni]|uniref:Uncharacterized protein n=1 Tax=Paramecium sonneborni TaxID=65129 RepID=A0A8S1RSB3_9CILI|nr:unnamed protein product [Paramecium sonneborni]